jgi:hypothetical protein
VCLGYGLFLKSVLIAALLACDAVAVSRRKTIVIVQIRVRHPSATACGESKSCLSLFKTA